MNQTLGFGLLKKLIGMRSDRSRPKIFSFQSAKRQELNGFRTLVLEFEEQVIGSCLIQTEDQLENPSLKLLWLEILPKL